MKLNRSDKRNKRRLSMKAKIRGSIERPRLAVFRSNTNLYVQLIDDVNGKTICSASSLDKDIAMRGKANKVVAEKIGKSIGKKAIDLNVKQVVFDRSGYSYHGVIQQLADSARESGLKF